MGDLRDSGHSEDGVLTQYAPAVLKDVLSRLCGCPHVVLLSIILPSEESGCLSAADSTEDVMSTGANITLRNFPRTHGSFGSDSQHSLY